MILYPENLMFKNKGHRQRSQTHKDSLAFHLDFKENASEAIKMTRELITSRLQKGSKYILTHRAKI